jgi:predicted alpha/beta superfamily hydrolase
MVGNRFLVGLKAIACCLIWFYGSTVCSGQAEKISIGERKSLFSKVLNEQRELLIYTPDNYPLSSGSYPVLYLLDAEWHFHMVSGVVKQLSANGDIPELIVVGLVNANRSRDLTPSGQNDNPLIYGGADKFLDFIVDEVQPLIESDYRVHPYRMIYGHSFGGLFAVYALLNRPDFFDSYLVLSPSLGRNDQQQVKAARSFFSDHQLLSSSLFLAVGNEGGNTFIATSKLAEVLEKQQADQFFWGYQHLPNEDHGSITVGGLLKGLAFIFDGFNFERETELDEIFLVEKHYQELSERLGFEVAVPELAYQKFVQEQIGARDLDYALFILGRYQQSYPDSIELIQMLADVWLLKGDFVNAKKYYGQLLDLGVQNERVKQIMKYL